MQYSAPDPRVHVLRQRDVQKTSFINLQRLSMTAREMVALPFGFRTSQLIRLGDCRPMGYFVKSGSPTTPINLQVSILLLHGNKKNEVIRSEGRHVRFLNGSLFALTDRPSAALLLHARWYSGGCTAYKDLLVSKNIPRACRPLAGLLDGVAQTEIAHGGDLQLCARAPVDVKI